MDVLDTSWTGDNGTVGVTVEETYPEGGTGHERGVIFIGTETLHKISRVKPRWSRIGNSNPERRSWEGPMLKGWGELEGK